ncbi:MAG TPA: GTPase domain-containing protein [Vicinamibacteria bacterium]|nr:GTPase domain-containing protein [Vicinamibacteria bacterium]
MVQFNFSERTIKAKVVYYGPPQSGKTTNLEQIHRLTDPEGSNRLISLNTAQDRTLFFDLLPFSLGTVSGYDFKIQLYTVPGQVQYNATRRVVLAGADAVVFVADSHKSMARENVAAFENMKVNLLANRLVPEKVPFVLQYNKQDLDPLTPRADLDRALNAWNRKAFPAVASRGEGVLETFVAVVQDMLASIAVKYNLKEKGLDPDSVPAVVAQAFAEIVQKVASPPPPSPSRGRVVIAQPEGAEPAYPGQVGPEVSPVSEELLHRAIRSNIDLAEALAQVVRDVSQGLALVQTQASLIAGGRTDATLAAAAIEREVLRLGLLLKDLGQAAARTSPGRAPAPPQLAPTPPRGTAAAAHPPPPPSPPASPAAANAPSPAPAPLRPPTPAPPTPAAPSAASLDGLVAEVLAAVRATLAARPVGVESRIARGAALPRCSPAALRRALAALLHGLAGVVTPASAILMRAERKPVLLRGRDGREVKRDFLMIALTHAAGLGDADQQRVLKGADPGPLGEAQRLVREMGGFTRFAPLPGGALETRVFLPA